MKAGPKRLGVFGGAFDPPHNAHLALVQAAVAQLRLDELRVFPTGQAWHKAWQLSPARHRLAMAELAFSGLPQVSVDARETRRAGPSYTIDTLRELQEEDPAAELFLVIGEDQANALQTWHEWRDILRLAIICVAEREELTRTTPQFVPPKLLESRFRQLQMPSMPISATDIRSRIATHQGIGPLVPGPVARYIDHHHLYQAA